MISYANLEGKLPLTTSVLSDTSKYYVPYDFKIITLLPGVQGSSLSMSYMLQTPLHCFIFLEITLVELQKAFKVKVLSLMLLLKAFISKSLKGLLGLIEALFCIL